MKKGPFTTPDKGTNDINLHMEGPDEENITALTKTIRHGWFEGNSSFGGGRGEALQVRRFWLSPSLSMFFIAIPVFKKRIPKVTGV